MKKKIVTLCLSAALVATLLIGGTLAYFTDTTDDVKNTFTMGKVDIELDEAPVDGDGKTTTGDRVTENNYVASMVPGHVFDKDPTIHVKAGSEESYVFLDMSFNKFSSLFWVMAADASADQSINFTIFNADGTLKADFKNDNGVFSTTKFIEAMKADKVAFQAMAKKWFDGITHEDWEICDIIIDGTYLTVRLGYFTTVNAETADVNIKFMDSFGMPASVTQEMIEAGKEVGGMQNNFNTSAEGFHLNFKAYAIQADELESLEAAYDAMF